MLQDKCNAECEQCVKKCPGDALIKYGKKITVPEVMEEVKKDALFYRNNGGLTISGGEPLFQSDFTINLLENAKNEGINTAMETCGAASEQIFLKAASHLNYLLMDIKLMDESRHKQATGAASGQILQNIRLVRQCYPDLTIHVRTPVIPGINDRIEDIEQIAEFVESLGINYYELLPYHRLGMQKYEYLNRQYQLPSDLASNTEHFKKLQETARQICKNVIFK